MFIIQYSYKTFLTMIKRKPISAEQIEQNKFIYTEHFLPDYADLIATTLLKRIDRYYFRSEFIGFEDYPQRNNPERPLIFISNHSGMAFPWDAIIFTAGIYRQANQSFKDAVRVLTSPMLSQSVLMNPFLVNNFWKKVGSVDATFLNFETMMHNNETNLLMYPEGVPGIGKGFHKKYQLQRFSSSFVRMSIKYKTDIIPVATVNGEYINPYNLKSDFINSLSQRIGIPFIPVGLMSLLIPFQPWIFYFGFPAKLTYVLGERIKPYEMVDKEFHEISEHEFRRITDEVKNTMQIHLDRSVRQYGKKHYHVIELVKNWKNDLLRFPYFLPVCWPAIFEEFDKLYRMGNQKTFRLKFLSVITIIKHNPITVAFFIPLLLDSCIVARNEKTSKIFKKTSC